MGECSARSVSQRWVDVMMVYDGGFAERRASSAAFQRTISRRMA